MISEVPNPCKDVIHCPQYIILLLDGRTRILLRCNQKNYEQVADSIDGIMVYADTPSRFGGILWASVNPR